MHAAASKRRQEEVQKRIEWEERGALSMLGKAPLRAVWRKVAEGTPEQQAIIEYHHIGVGVATVSTCVFCTYLLGCSTSLKTRVAVWKNQLAKTSRNKDVYLWRCSTLSTFAGFQTHFGYVVSNIHGDAQNNMTLTAFASCILQGNISGGNRRLKTSSGPTTGRVSMATLKSTWRNVHAG